MMEFLLEMAVKLLQVMLVSTGAKVVLVMGEMVEVEIEVEMEM